MLFFTLLYNGQITSLFINNYTPHYIKARIFANGLNGNCYPSVISEPSPGQSTWQMPPAFSPTDPFNVTYEKYYYSDLASVPVMNWYRKTSATNPYIYTSHNSAAFLPTGVIATNTDWSFMWMQTFDGGNISLDDFFVGSPANNCNGPATTYQVGTYSEAEWFTIGNNTFVQIYEI